MQSVIGDKNLTNWKRPNTGFHPTPLRYASRRG